MPIFAFDAMRRLRLVKATASPRARGRHDAQRTRQGHSDKLEWLATGRAGEAKGGQQNRRHHYSRRTWNSVRCDIRAGPDKISG